MFRRTPARRPHPDPAVEADLQRILSCRRMIAAKEAQADHDLRLIRKLDRRAQRSRGDLGTYERVTLSETLRDEVRLLEQAIVDLHGAIGDIIASLKPDDLLWL